MLSTMTLLTMLLNTPFPVTQAPQVPELNTEAPEFKVMVTEAPKPIRSARPVTIMGEIGVNGLAGMGLNLSLNLHPNWSIDSGFGLSMSGYKLGLRGRYNFLQSNFTPFLAVGATLGSGLAMVPVDLNSMGSGSVYVRPSPFAQAVAGVSWVNDSGFAMMASVGWAQLLSKNGNYSVQPGSTYTAEGLNALDRTLGSGLVASLGMGYAF